MTRILLALAAIVTVTAAEGQDRGAWFKSLKQPGSGFSCCDVSDCKKTDAEWRDGQWWADYKGVMIPVPPKTEIDVLSLDGSAYLCANPNYSAANGHIPQPTVYCFVKPGMGS